MGSGPVLYIMKNMKKIMAIAVMGQILAMGLATTVAGAQTVDAANAASASVGVGASGQGQAAPGIIVAPRPIAPPPVNTDSGFMQFNNLTVQSVSGTNPPAEIVAVSPAIVPMIYNSTNAPSNSAANVKSGTCYRFNAENDNAGMSISCPTPSSAASTTAAGAAPAIYPAPAPMPVQIQPYKIEIDASTKLYLRDRTPATLGDFSAGDEINVFGYYNTDGSIQAYLVRDISKPVQSQTLQLNNVDLVSLSASTTPATLVVAQQTIYPCYGFGANGNGKQAIACPMGISSSAANSALQNAPVPSALMPTWAMSRKYQINIDANTIILDSNRTALQLSDLQVGDELNVYGETNDNGRTITADIVRDLSIPATAQNYTGTVTQVNTDGSFNIQTSDGRTLTVQSPIQVGATLRLVGILNRLTNVLSQVTSIISGNGVMPPLPASAPGQLRIQGGPVLPPNASGTPNTQN